MECLRYPGAEFGSVEEELPPSFGMSECVREIPSAVMGWSDRRVTLSGECRSPGGRSEPRLGNPTMERKRARGRIKGTGAGVFWKELFAVAWVLENELEWLTQAAERGKRVRLMHIKFTSAQNSNFDDLM